MLANKGCAPTPESWAVSLSRTPSLAVALSRLICLSELLTVRLVCCWQQRHKLALIARSVPLVLVLVAGTLV